MLLESNRSQEILKLIQTYRDQVLREMVSPQPKASRDELAAEVRAYDKLHREFWQLIQDAKTN